jgi:Tfp pilus assembly protein PilN
MALREINLIPAEVLHKKHLTRRLFLWAGCLTLSLALICGFYVYQVHVALPKNRPKTTLEDMHKQLGATIEEIKDTQQQIQRLSLQESFLQKLSRIQPFSMLLLKLSEIMNAQTWLTKLSMDAGTEEEDVVPSMNLYGFSLSNEALGNFLTQLSGEPLFEDVGLKYAKETQITRSPRDRKALIKVIQFQIDCKISRS